MPQQNKLLARLLSGDSDANIDFNQLRRLLHDLGFDERTRGSHHIFTQTAIVERINLQAEGRHAKPYQIEQVRDVINKYQLGGQVND